MLLLNVSLKICTVLGYSSWSRIPISCNLDLSNLPISYADFSNRSQNQGFAVFIKSGLFWWGCQLSVKIKSELLWFCPTNLKVCDLLIYKYNIYALYNSWKFSVFFSALLENSVISLNMFGGRQRMHSFGMIQIRINDQRSSAWIVVCQRNHWSKDSSVHLMHHLSDLWSLNLMWQIYIIYYNFVCVFVCVIN